MGAFLTTHVKMFCLPICQLKIGWDTAADIAIRYGQDGSGIPKRGEIFLPRPDRPCATPTALYNGYWVSSPGAKRPGSGANHPPPHLAPMLNEQYRYTSIPPIDLHALF